MILLINKKREERKSPIDEKEREHTLKRRDPSFYLVLPSTKSNYGNQCEVTLRFAEMQIGICRFDAVVRRL